MKNVEWVDFQKLKLTPKYSKGVWHSKNIHSTFFWIVLKFTTIFVSIGISPFCMVSWLYPQRWKLFSANVTFQTKNTNMNCSVTPDRTCISTRIESKAPYLGNFLSNCHVMKYCWNIWKIAKNAITNVEFFLLFFIVF